MLKKIGLVIPWFGKELKGGAEQQAWQLAHRFQARGIQTEVLTTCSRSFHHDWGKNSLPPGESFLPSGVKVLRFPVIKRDNQLFHQGVSILLGISPPWTPGALPIPSFWQDVYCRENIRSSELIDYVKKNKESWDGLIGLPYLFPLVFEAVLAAEDRGILQPCLHDEPYAYLYPVMNAFAKIPKLFFNSKGEQKLAERLYGSWIQKKSFVVSEGVEIHEQEPQGPSHLLLKNPYFLYLGKKCQEKKTDLLVKSFDLYCAVENLPSIHLVLAGSGTLPCASMSSRIVDLGLVSDTVKRHLLEGCLALVNPSVNESFSRIVFESWALQKPVIVHSQCLATRYCVEESGGGWLANDEVDWARVMAQVALASKVEREERGRLGHAYGQQWAQWDGVMTRYEEALSQKEATTASYTLWESEENLAAPLLGLKAGGDLTPQSRLLYWGDSPSKKHISALEVWGQHFSVQMASWESDGKDWKPFERSIEHMGVWHENQKKNVQKHFPDIPITVRPLPCLWSDIVLSSPNWDVFLSQNDETLHVSFLGILKEDLEKIEKAYERIYGGKIRLWELLEKENFSTYLALSDVVVLGPLSEEKWSLWAARSVHASVPVVGWGLEETFPSFFSAEDLVNGLHILEQNLSWRERILEKNRRYLMEQQPGFWQSLFAVPNGVSQDVTA